MFVNTHNLCFGAKIRKIGKLLQTPVLLYMGFKGVFIAQTCFPDGCPEKCCSQYTRQSMLVHACICLDIF